MLMCMKCSDGTLMVLNYEAQVHIGGVFDVTSESRNSKLHIRAYL